MNLFPYDKVRPEQNKLMADIKDVVEKGGNLIAHAPTGLGKTAAALAPALEFAIEKGQTVFILTSRNTQHNQIIKTLREINLKHKIVAVDFIGKKGMCPHILEYDTNNFVDFCNSQRKKGECRLLNKTIKKSEFTSETDEFIKALIAQGPLNVEEVVSHCSNKFCAYELSMRMAQQADVIIADYYHIFSPKIRKFFLNKIKKELAKSIIIVDEAHNLPARIRNLLTSKTNTFALNRLSDEIKKDSPESEIMLKDISNRLKMHANNILNNLNETKINKKDFIEIVEEAAGMKYDALIESFKDALEEIEDPDNEDNLNQFVDFLKSWQGDDAGFIRILKREKTKSGRPFISLEYNCLHPGSLAKFVFGTSYASILMSGTLTPGQMYRDVLGLDENTIIKEYQNPFPKKNRLVLISSDITTKYAERTEQMFKKIASSCAYMINNVKGNSAVFFSSYDILSKTMFYLDKLCEKDKFIEVRGMNKTERQELINNFKRNIINGGGVLMGVQGANFSEGIDLPGELLKAVAIVGVPLAPPNLTQKAVIEYYQTNFGKGWEYGYTYPAMNRALQAAGRCIRSEKDKGVIAFLDKRFSWSKYSGAIPKDWSPELTDYFGDKIHDFFSS
jgi:DNA excision repair protein ERCC-2